MHKQCLVGSSSNNEAIDNGTKLIRIEKCNAILKKQGGCYRQWGGDRSGIRHQSLGKKILYILPLGKD